METHGRVDVQLCSLTSTIDAGGYPHAPAAFPLGKVTPIPIKTGC